MDPQAAPASVLQLSTFTTVKSIPRPERYADFPVTVRLVAPGREQTVRGLIDIVAAIDRSMSVSDDQKLEKEKAALALLVDMLLPGDRLAVVPFDDSVTVAKDEEELVVLSAEGKQKALSKVNSLKVGPGKGTWLSKALQRAEQILLNRGDVDRAAFVILLSDGGDEEILKEKEWTRNPPLNNPAALYPVHAFGFSGQNPQSKSAKTMGYIATRTNGTYTAVDGADDKFVGAAAGLVGKAASRLFSAVEVAPVFAAVHPGVSIVKIDSGDRRASLGGDARKGVVDVGAMSAGQTLEFTVYLDVPEGDADVEATEVLFVGGTYKQDWDREQVDLGSSIVSVERPVPLPPTPPTPPPQKLDCCEELDLIEERLKYWCKVKVDLAGMYEKAEAEAVGGGDRKCQCEVAAAAFRESSLESVNRAMHHDIYTAVVHALKLRKCSTAMVTEDRCDGDKAVTTTEAA